MIIKRQKRFQNRVNKTRITKLPRWLGPSEQSLPPPDYISYLMLISIETGELKHHCIFRMNALDTLGDN